MPTLFQLPKAVPISAGSGFSGAKAYFYEPGTLTPITTYTTAALAVAHAHPVQADANGVFAPIFLNETINSTYRLQLKTSADVLIYDVDNLPALAAATNDWRYRITAAETGAGLTVTDLTLGYDPGDLRRYGAVLDGVTDDAVALSRALATHGVLPWVGTCYYTSAVTASATMQIRGYGGASILKPAASAVAAQGALTLAGADSLAEGFHIDGSLCANYQLLNVTGARCVVDISVSGMGAQLGAVNCCGVRVEGANCDITLNGRNFANTGSTNASFPQLLLLADTCVDPTVRVRGTTIQSGLVTNAGCLRPRILTAEFRDVADNGVYDLGAINGWAGDVVMHDAPEFWVSAVSAANTGNSFHIENLTVFGPEGAGGAVRLKNCDRLTIGTLTAFYDITGTLTNFPSLVSLRTGNTTTGKVHIGKIYAVTRSDAVFSLATGVLTDLIIDDLVLDHYIVAAGQQNDIYTQSGTPCKLTLGRARITVTDSTGGGARNYLWTIPSGIGQSYIGEITANVPSGHEFRFNGIAIDNIATLWNDASDMTTAPRLRDTGGIVGRRRKILFAGAVPTTGTWRAGDIVFRSPPAVGSPWAWFCTTAGTPGTWTASANL